MKVDFWVWGTETIVSGENDDFTIKILEPKDGLSGVLSLQAHEKKHEYWIIKSGKGIAQFIVADSVLTVIATSNMIFKIAPNLPHRLGSLSHLKVIEVSTLDEHSLDKNKSKDVVRYHCFHGRPCLKPNSRKFNELVSRSVEEFVNTLNTQKVIEQKKNLVRLSEAGIFLGKV
ncbi:MAG: hypothetical protein NZO16_01385 [Deltaproteobacteria bacterium]|nr:hypothetical protein [Deltaproteobacteria bacterium]